MLAYASENYSKEDGVERAYKVVSRGFPCSLRAMQLSLPARYTFVPRWTRCLLSLREDLWTSQDLTMC